MTINFRLSVFVACIGLSFVSGGMSFAQTPSYRPYLGVTITAVTDKIAEVLGIKDLHGAFVEGVDDQGPSKAADIEAGDLIVKIDGRDVAEASDVQRVVVAAQIGKEVPVVIIRMGEVKTKTVRLGNVALLRIPTCDDLLRVSDRVSPNAIEKLFGKREDYMSISDLGQAIDAVARCEREIKSGPRSLATAVLGQDLITLGANLESKQSVMMQRQRATYEAALEPRLVAEQKATKARADAEQCRQQCHQRLVAMLDQLRSLGTDEQSIKRLRELGREHQALIDEMPPDVTASLKDLNDAFVAEYGNRDAAASQVEEQVKQKREAERETAEKTQQLQMLYTYYMEIQVCAERFAQFDSTRSALRDVLKGKETGLPPEQVDGIWNSTAEKFKRLEAVLKVAGDAQLYTECDQASRSVAGLIMLVPGIGASSQDIPLRKKDF